MTQNTMYCMTQTNKAIRKWRRADILTDSLTVKISIKAKLQSLNIVDALKKQNTKQGSNA